MFAYRSTRFLATAAVAATTVTALQGTGHADAGAAGEPERPNVLIVVTDDQPRGMMGAMPATRRWLASGTRYANTVASTPVCCPARASILSGRYVHNHDVHTLSDAYRFDFGMSLPNTLQRAGYITAIAGKYFNGWNLQADDPRDFDRFAIFAGGYESDIRSDPQTHTEVAGAEDAPPVSHSGDTTATVHEAGLAMLADFENSDSEPWMLYLAPFAPHGPQAGEHAPGYGDAPRLRVHVERDLSDKPPHVRDVTRKMHVRAPQRTAHRQMYRSLRAVDDMMADVRAQLQASGELDNTMVVFTSDNGYLFGQHGLWNKREPYEASVRVPLFVWWPGHVADDVDRRIAGLVDIAPTIYDAADVRAGYPVDGQSLFGPATRERILIEHFGGGVYDQNVGDWVGWWKPGAMYRRSFYGRRGSRGCFDRRARRTICQRYRRAAGQEEVYRGRRQTHNLLKHGARARGHRRWIAAASECVGWRCHRMEARRGLRVNARPWVRVHYRGPRWFRTGRARTVRVVARNVSGRRLRVVRLRLERNPQWSARPLDRRRFRWVRPGERVSTRWRVRFHGTGRVSLSTWARFTRGGWERAWDAAPVRVRPRR